VIAAPATLSTDQQPVNVATKNGCLLRVYQDIHDLDALRPAWDELLDKYSLASTFSTWEWLTCWWRAYGAKRRLLVLGVFDQNQRLIGLAPLSIADELFGGVTLRVLRMMGDGSNDSDNLDLPVFSGFEDVFANSIIDYLSKHRAQWDICQLNTIPIDSPIAARLSRVAKSRGWTVREDVTGSSAVHLPASWDEYLAMLSSEDRKNLPRYTRRLQNRHATRIYRCDIDSFPRCVEALFQLHQARWESAGEPGSFSSLQRRNFYWELSCALLERGWLEMWALELDGEIQAVQFAFRYKDHVFQLQEGYDHRRSSDRPGYVLRGEVLKTLIQQGVRVYDFLGGGDSYKARWAAKPGSYRTIKFAPRFTKGGLFLEITSQAANGKRWLRRNLPDSAWSLLKEINSVRRGLSAHQSSVS
jgi:CelD/BcsL family acetyltransferase involved in cellulose biosynthesis